MLSSVAGLEIRQEAGNIPTLLQTPTHPGGSWWDVAPKMRKGKCFFPLFSRSTSKLVLALRVPVVGSPDGSL